jgi:hypothetical protein
MKRIMTVLLIGILPILWAQNQGDFSWSMSLVMNNTEAPDSYSRPISMKNGDIFNILVKSDVSCYCYIVAQDSERNVLVLYSGRLNADDELNLGPIQITPPPGSELFFVVMGQGIQRELDNKISTFMKNQSQRAAGDVMDEIFSLRRSVSALRENPEKPVLMGGAFRDVETSIPGITYSGAGIYVKSITIRH